jgi:hypothetical protein
MGGLTKSSIGRLDESDIQRAIFMHVRVRGAPNTFAFHVPNGGLRSRTEAAIFKGLGVTAGIPDIIVIRGGRVFALEVKSVTGRLSPEQTKVLALMRAAGCDTGIAYGLDDALAWLELRGLLRGTAKVA